MYPSGAALATALAPTVPEAPPGRFSTMKCWPAVSLSFCTRMRATPSTDPPAGNGTTTVTVREGYVCAGAGVAATRASASAGRVRIRIGRSFQAGGSICPGVASSVDQKILAGDETGMLGAEKRAIGAELGGSSVAAGRIGGGALAPDLVEALAARI